MVYVSILYNNKCEIYTLYPENIVIDSCYINIYILNEINNNYDLCKDLNESFPYKLINNESCLKDKTNKTYYLIIFKNIIDN